jgi:hypothetical protein
MAPEPAALSLYEGMRRAGMSFEDVWLAQLGVGGDADAMTVEAYILGLLIPDYHQHNLIAQAINEYFIDRGDNHPVAYADHQLR